MAKKFFKPDMLMSLFLEALSRFGIRETYTNLTLRIDTDDDICGKPVVHTGALKVVPTMD